MRARISLEIVISNSLLLRGHHNKGARIRQRPELTDGAVMSLLAQSRRLLAHRRPHQHYTVVCVCNILLVVFYATPPYLRRHQDPSSYPLHYPSYTPTTIYPLLYADSDPSPCPSPWNRLILSVPSLSPRFSHVRALEVPSLLHPSALVSSKCVPLFRKGRGGAG